MADFSKYFVGQASTGQTGLQPMPTGSTQTGGLQPLSSAQKVQMYQEQANKSKAESDKINSFGGQAAIFGKELVGGLANAFLKQPARFVASTAAAPVDLAKQAYGLATNKDAAPYEGKLPLIGRTFQGQASVDQKDIANGKQPLVNALKPFAEVPLAALETVSLAQGVKQGAQVFQKTAAAGKEKYLTDLVTPPESAAKSSGFMKAIKSGRVSEAGIFNGRSVAPDQRTVALVDELKTVPGIKKGQTALNAGNAVWKEIGNTAQGLRKDLQSMDVQPTVNADDLENLYSTAKDTVSKNPFLTGDAEKTVGQIFHEFVSRLPQDRAITAEDVLNARQGVDGWIESQRGANIFDPAKENAVSVALRSIRQGANGLLAEKAPSVAVKEALLRQTRLYDALDQIALKAAKEKGISAAAKVSKPILQWLGRGIGAAAPVGAAYYLGQAQKSLSE